MKAYDLPNGSKVLEECSDGSKYFIFNHPDGMYSHCTTEKGETVHLGLNEEMEKVEGGYKFKHK